MHESKFWRLVAVSAVAGLFYLGHGLHTARQPAPALPEILGKANADDIITYRTPTSFKELDGAPALVTRSPDGKTIYIYRWVLDKGETKPKIVFQESVSAERG